MRSGSLRGSIPAVCLYISAECFFLIRLRAQQRGITCATTAEIFTGGSERWLKFKFPNVVFQFGRFFLLFVVVVKCARRLSTFQEETQLKGRPSSLFRFTGFSTKPRLENPEGAWDSQRSEPQNRSNHAPRIQQDGSSKSKQQQ